MQGRERAGIVEQMASFCDAQAGAEVQDPGNLEWSARLPRGSLWTSTVTTWERDGVHPQTRMDGLRLDAARPPLPAVPAVALGGRPHT
jgi:hypothetical protein